MDYASAILSWIFWLFIIFAILSPTFHQRSLDAQRVNLIKRFEKKRNSRVILLVHRQRR